MEKKGSISTQAKGSIAFDDAEKGDMMPVKVKVWTGAAVDAVLFEYSGTAGEKHGGNGGGCHEKEMGDGKFIKKLRATTGRFGGADVLTALAFYDQDGNLLAGNERSGNVKELVAKEGECISALYGETVNAAGINIVSGIGIYTCKVPDVSDLFGSLGSIKGKLF